MECRRHDFSSRKNDKNYFYRFIGEDGRCLFKVSSELQEAFEETGALKGVEVMGERVDNKELFKEWLYKQHKQDGNVYSANTISAYCSALSKSPEKLEGIDDDCKRSIFVYDDVGANRFNIFKATLRQALYSNAQ